MAGQPQPLHIRRGPSINSSRNFLFLLNAEDIQADFFAFSDQDDIWHTDKIGRALNWHASVPKDTPNLYGGRTRLVDESGKPIGFSSLFSKKPAFSNALVQSIAGGNTVIFNKNARELARIFKDGIDVVSHEWWLYILVAGAGGSVYHDPIPVMDYRQHDANLVGSSVGMGAALLRLKKLMRGEFREWTEKHLILLKEHLEVLTPDNRIILECFEDARSAGFFRRIRGIPKSGVYRQTRLGHLGILAAICFRKV